MSYVSTDYKKTLDGNRRMMVCIRGSKHGPYDDKTNLPPFNLTGSPDFCGGCVAYVTVACPSLPVRVEDWKKGAAVKGNRFVREGTVIATFDENGQFHGHAAIYVRQAPDGIVVWDQYDTPIKGIGERTLHWNSPTFVNNGGFFYVVE